MTPFASTISLLFSWATLGGHVAIVCAAILLALVIFEHPNQTLHMLSRKAADHAFLFGFLISLFSLVASLIYSNAIGFDPCELCWWQRIFIYPQAVLFGVALYNQHVRKVQDDMVFLYSLVMSIIGAAIAAFQYYGQMFDPELLAACTSQGASCAKLYFVSFGYITIPMMSLTAYIFLILFYFFHRHHYKKR